MIYYLLLLRKRFIEKKLDLFDIRKSFTILVQLKNYL